MFPTRFDTGIFGYRGDNGRERARCILITRLLLVAFELISQPANDDRGRRYPPGELSDRIRQPRSRYFLEKADADRIRVAGINFGFSAGHAGVEPVALERIRDN